MRIRIKVKGLLSKGSYAHRTMTASGMMASRTTKLGNGFLDYIIETAG